VVVHAGAVVPAVGGSATAAATLTVILPVFNESATLPATCRTVGEFAAAHPAIRFVFVDDGSSDATRSILAGEMPEWTASIGALAPMSFLSYSANKGKGFAIKTAVERVDSDLVCFMDGDLAYGLDHLAEITSKLRTSDVVIGSRRESPEERRNTKKLRRLMGWIFNGLVRVGVGLPFEDTQAGLKGFRTPAARIIFSRTRLRGFAFDVEALFIARRHGFSISEIPARVSRSHRKKPSNVNLYLEPLRMARDLMTIRLHGLLGRYR
jgi:glycosyltransferase involved in cell wall biosynthesis